ncbi:hypothetical protein ACQP25_00395 [Microtetraspora malaysiensis]|uniref:hypothetical protein n=1 Tax=Microtetraspora malaysiensis TaxID=161358 RepID=UPI003D90EFBA
MIFTVAIKGRRNAPMAPSDQQAGRPERMALSRLPDRELRAPEGVSGGVLYGPARPYSTGKPF